MDDLRKKIIVNFSKNKTRIAVIEKEEVVEVYLERPLQQRLVGNIFKGVVANVLPGMQAAFIDIGYDKNGFLYIDDLYWPLEEEDVQIQGGKKRSIDKLLREGEEIMVQVVREPFGSKGARLSCQVTIPGRYLVLMPGADYVGISRRIENIQERERLKKEMDMVRPSGVGVIVRTVAEGKKSNTLANELFFLQKTWDKVQNQFWKKQAPALLYHDLTLLYRIIRDLFLENVEELIIDNVQGREKVLDILDTLSPHLKDKVILYEGTEPIFEYFNIEREIEKALEKIVWLNSGGYLVFDKTEALTAIDVNTGRYVGKDNLSETVTKINLEAAEEIARQLRIRDIGGIIIIDFIDMDNEEHRQQVLDKLNNKLKNDRTKSYVMGITSLGLVEMTRKKIRQGLAEIFLAPCPNCKGEGKILTPPALLSQIERKLKQILKNTMEEAALVELSYDVLSHLSANQEICLRVEKYAGKYIFLQGNENIKKADYNIRVTGKKTDIEKTLFASGYISWVKIENKHPVEGQKGQAYIHGHILNIDKGGEKVGEVVKVKITKPNRFGSIAEIVE